MLNKTLAFVGALFAAVFVLGFQTQSKADGFYIYAMHGADQSAPCITIGYTNNGANGQIYHYDCATGNSYSGFVTNVVVTGPSSGVIYSIGYVNGWQLSIATDEVRADGTNMPHVYDYAANNGSYVASSNSIELMNQNDSLSGSVFWGSEYIW